MRQHAGSLKAVEPWFMSVHEHRLKSFGFLRRHFCFGPLSFLILEVLILYHKVKQSRTLVLTQLKKALHHRYQHEPNTSMDWLFVLLTFQQSHTSFWIQHLNIWVASFLHDCSSDSEDFQAVVVADSNPVGLGGGPLYIIDLSLGRVGQYRVLNGPRHLLDVPD